MVTDMIVAIVSIYLNLMVTMAIKAGDELAARTQQSVGGDVKLSVLLTNLCTSNIGEISSILIGRAPTLLRSHWSRASCTERSYYRRP